MADNDLMLRVFRGAGFAVRGERAGDDHFAQVGHLEPVIGRAFLHLGD